MTIESAIGAMTALAGLIGAVWAVYQGIKARNAPPPGDDDVDEHLIDELVAARVELELMRRNYSGQRGPVPGA